jgi:hypothetical protein
VVDYRYRYPFPVEESLDFGTSPAPPPKELDAGAGAQVREENVPAKYSPIFKMGLFFSVPCLSPVLLLPTLHDLVLLADGPRFRSRC